MQDKLKHSREIEAVYLEFMQEAVPNSRERSLALTNLQQARMWINEAISKEG